MIWYSARCLFLHKGVQGFSTNVYEERIVLLQATSEDEALSKAKEDADHYAAADQHIYFTGEVEIYSLSEETLGDTSEVFSSTRMSSLDTYAYIRRFYNRGRLVPREDR